MHLDDDSKGKTKPSSVIEGGSTLLESETKYKKCRSFIGCGVILSSNCGRSMRIDLNARWICHPLPQLASITFKFIVRSPQETHITVAYASRSYFLLGRLPLTLRRADDKTPRQHQHQNTRSNLLIHSFHGLIRDYESYNIFHPSKPM